jgi:outer membrane protein, multidrug efflux system
MHRLFVVAVFASLFAGCAVGPDYEPPSTSAPNEFANANSIVYGASASAEEFWRLFEDPLLEQLVGDALAANHELRIALANLAEARAVHRLSRFDLAPTITANAGYTEQRLATAQATGVARDQEVYEAGFDAFWELDFFGRVRRGIEADRAVGEAAEANLHDAQITIVGDVIRTYYELRGAQLRLGVVHRNVENQAASLDLTTVRYEAGRGTELDTSRARSQLSSTKADLAPVETAVTRSIHRLSVLTAREPDALRGALTPTQDLPALPALVPISDPATLLRRRPDIRVAERELAAATARIGVAVADLFPQVTFVGSVGFAANNRQGLGDTGSDGYLLAPGISWAAFDLGRVRARIGAARARTDAALANYELTVLRALEETENALATHAASRKQLADVEAAAEASRTAARLARVQYEHGVNDFLQVLDAERTLLDLEDRYAQTRTEAATSLVAVYKALGGGWSGAR